MKPIRNAKQYLMNIIPDKEVDDLLSEGLVRYGEQYDMTLVLLMLIEKLRDRIKTLENKVSPKYF